MHSLNKATKFDVKMCFNYYMTESQSTIINLNGKCGWKSLYRSSQNLFFLYQ